jgi:hypothetical protein
MNEPAQAHLRELFDFDAEAGQLIWRERAAEVFASVNAGKTWNARFAGTSAGYVNESGYRLIGVDGKMQRAHRLIWIYANGPIPAGIQIDHISGNRDDNRLDNLRLVTNAENSRNSSMPSRNTSDVLGVCWNKRARKWLAQIRIAGRQKHLGLFDTLEAAAAARAKADRQFGFHANHGKRPAAKAEGSSHA